jgi:LysM repeat protein
VVSKDNLYSIALSFGTTSRELRKLNKLEGDDTLSVGQYLLVPVADDSLYES